MGKKAYYSWLLNFVADESQQDLYSKTFDKMFNTGFYWSVNNDENRAWDGIELRASYIEEGGVLNARWMAETPCSMLEMMIALAIRCEDDIMHEPKFGDRTGKWFWYMMKNSGLITYDNPHFSEKKVLEILDDICSRDHSKSGTGGLFCATFFQGSFKELEFWDQMCAFCTENYFF